MAHSILFQRLRRTLHKAYHQSLDSVKASETSKGLKYKRS